MSLVERAFGRRVIAAVAAVAAVAMGVAASGLSSAAAWKDQEWDRAGEIGALDCDAPLGAGESAARGRILSGTLLGVDLDTVAAVHGVAATSDGTNTTPVPASAATVPGSAATAFKDPLPVEVLRAIFLDLGDVLQVPLETGVGVYNQYARAGHDLTSTGAAGAVADDGAISLTEFDDALAPDERPQFASLHLSELLTTALGQPLSSLVANVTDLRLAIGAVAAYAQLDGCGAAWNGDTVHDVLERDYAIAGLDLDIDSPTVGALGSTVDGTLTALEPALAGITGGTSGIVSGISGALGGVLNGLGLGDLDIGLSLGIDTAAVHALLDDTLSDDAGIVRISLTSGTVHVDLEKLLGPAYGGSVGLNGLAPNTELLLNGPVLTSLTQALSAALQDWIDDVIRVLYDSISVTLSIEAGLRIGIITVAELSILTGPTPGVATAVSLGSLLRGESPVTVGLERTGLYGIVCLVPLVADILCGVVDGLLSALVGPVLAGLLSAIGGVIEGTIGVTLTGLEGTLNGLINPLVTMLSATLGGLFGEGGLLSIVMNAQNDPDPTLANVQPELVSWAGIDGAPQPGRTGRYDIAAITIGVVGLLDVVELHLSRASVGSNGVG